MSVTDDEVTAKVNPQRRVRTGKNTCAPSSKKKRMAAQLAGILAHLERHPNDQLSRARVAAIKAMGL